MSFFSQLLQKDPRRRLGSQHDNVSNMASSVMTGEALCCFAVVVKGFVVLAVVLVVFLAV